MQNAIEHECLCRTFRWWNGAWRYYSNDRDWERKNWKFCPVCGYALGADGIARRPKIAEDALPTIDEMQGILKAGE